MSCHARHPTAPCTPFHTPTPRTLSRSAYVSPHPAPSQPFWIAPVQVRLLPVSDDFRGYCEEVKAAAFEAGLRFEIDQGGRSVGKQIKIANQDKVPLYAVIGEKEIAAQSISFMYRKQVGASILRCGATWHAHLALFLPWCRVACHPHAISRGATSQGGLLDLGEIPYKEAVDALSLAATAGKNFVDDVLVVDTEATD